MTIISLNRGDNVLSSAGDCFQIFGVSVCAFPDFWVLSILLTLRIFEGEIMWDPARPRHPT